MIDISKFQITPHKGMSITADGKEADLYIYKNHEDGTGILTDGQNFYFAYNDLKSVGNQCPPGARFMTDNEAIVIKRSKDIISKVDTFVINKPTATEDEKWIEFKKEISLDITTTAEEN